MNIDLIVKFITSLLTSATAVSRGNSKNQLSASSPTASLKESNGYYIWNKGEIFKLSDHFSTKEMDCQCNYEACKEQKISKDLIQRIEKIRLEVNQPLVITSAFRCSKHQEDIRNSGASSVVAKKQSQHELGNAVDIRPKDEQGIRTTFLAICEKYFTTIGLSNRFLHVDIRKEKIQWEY